MRVPSQRLALVLASLGFWLPQSFASTLPHVSKKIPLTGNDGWDYLTADQTNRRLYITRSNHIAVYDLDTLSEVGNLGDIKGAHGVALALNVGRGFATNGKAAAVTMFDLKTLQVLAQIKTDDKPDAIVFEPKTGRVFAFNGDSSSATVIDAARGKAVGTVALGGQPEFSTVDEKGLVFANLEDKNSIVTIDADTMKVTNTYSIAPCDSPTGLSMDRASRRLFSVCKNKFMIVSNPDTGKVVATLPIGAGADAVIFDAQTKEAVSANGVDANITIVSEQDPDKFVVSATVATTSGARTLALDEKNHRLILVGAKFGLRPQATKENPHARASIVPGTVHAVVVSRE